MATLKANLPALALPSMAQGQVPLSVSPTDPVDQG